jgi:hypothetical protein
VKNSSTTINIIHQRHEKTTTLPVVHAQTIEQK